MHTYDARAITTAPPSRVWPLLLNPRVWPTWSPLDEFLEERSSGVAEDGTRGVGSVQSFRTGTNVDGERITEIVPEPRLAYVAQFNQTLLNYSAAVELSPAGEGTAIRWHGTYDVGPGLEEVVPPAIQAFMQQMVDGLAGHAGTR